MPTAIPLAYRQCHRACRRSSSREWWPSPRPHSAWSGASCSPPLAVQQTYVYINYLHFLADTSCTTNIHYLHLLADTSCTTNIHYLHLLADTSCTTNIHYLHLLADTSCTTNICTVYPRFNAPPLINIPLQAPIIISFQAEIDKII